MWSSKMCIFGRRVEAGNSEWLKGIKFFISLSYKLLILIHHNRNCAYKFIDFDIIHVHVGRKVITIMALAKELQKNGKPLFH